MAELNFEKEVRKALIRGHRHSTAIEDMTRIRDELEEKVDNMLLERAYEMCPDTFEPGNIVKHNGQGYSEYHYAYVRRILGDKQMAYDVQIVPLTKRYKRHKKYGVSSNHIWNYNIEKWSIHRKGKTMEDIGERSTDDDVLARERWDAAKARE